MPAIEGNECFASRMHSDELTSYIRKTCWSSSWSNVVCQEDASSGYSLDRSSLGMFANYKRLAVESLIPFVNEKRVLLSANR